MEINYYREPNSQGLIESWQACQFTAGTDLSAFSCRNLVTINGQPYIRQHHVTYLTGKETCRAHHFAKHLAIQILSKQSSSDPSASSDSSASSDPSKPACKVLWIDTVNSVHVAAAICRELEQHTADAKDLHYVCLDILGSQRDDQWWLNNQIGLLIKSLNPTLVVIDDIDHFMPNSGINLALDFNRLIRDTINHTDTAFLFIGYNHTGKKACTAGELGKRLFYSSNDIFALSTVRDVTTVRHICGHDLHVFPGDSQLHFTVGADNLPHEAPKPGAKPATGIDNDTLREILEGIIQTEAQNPDDTTLNITPAQLLDKVKARHRDLKQHTRDAALLDQIHALHLITPIPAGEENKTDKPGQASATSQASKSVQPVQPLPVDCAAAPQRLPHDQEINNSLTLPTHPRHSAATCPVGGGSAAV